MMPLSYAAPGEESVIRRIGGSPEAKKAPGKFGVCGRRQRESDHGDERRRDDLHAVLQKMPGSHQTDQKGVIRC